MQLYSTIKRYRPAAPARQTFPAVILRASLHRVQAVSQPSNAAEVVSWAKQQFLQEVGKPDGAIGLAKTCLVMALEEEAVGQLHLVGRQPRTGATAATWSLQRLDALAADVIDVLQQEHPQTLIPADSDSSSSSTKPAAARPRVLGNKVPMQVLGAVNSVLFGRQGYAACNRYGTPSDSQLATVLESGPGSCAALTVLYLEVCSRLDLPLGFKVLEGGRYCLAWPRGEEGQQHPLTAAGEACVLDVYGKGALLTVKEATELFAVTSEELFAGSSRRELLAALLAEQQHAYWCAAIGCSPQPAFMTQLSAASAVKQHVRQLNGLSIERATAAAEKRAALLPGDLQVQLELALLCYFSGRYEDAWLELGSYLEAVRCAAATDSTAAAAPAAAAAAAAAVPVAAGVAPAAPSAAAQRAATATATAGAGSDADEVVAKGMEAYGGLVDDDVMLLFEKLQLELMLGGADVA
ncbi:hypothetical protein OEZ85_006993 [Tetradesmus obliquus]|uniref:Protein SirB1 N-terminal domain-containing protein n=1 Tax=Tetradesmus obliquus TaxID=3088 RepID=A0ABY8U156_TETOB|nr:hypothetical protein OEZ85_006993 [Tetradesmus obliquus]